MALPRQSSTATPAALRLVSPERRMEQPGFTQVPNWLFDVAPILTGLEYQIVMTLARHTHGWHRESTTITAQQIADDIGSTRTPVTRAMANLVKLGIVTETPIAHGGRERSLAVELPAECDEKLLSYRESRELQKVTPESDKKSLTRVTTSHFQNGDLSAPGQGKTGALNKELNKELNKTTTPLPPAEVSTRENRPAQPAGGGGSASRLSEPTDTERWLVQQGMSAGNARRFGVLPLPAVQADYQRRSADGAGIGAIVEAWKVTPPTDAPAAPERPISADVFYYADITPQDRAIWLRRFRTAQPHERAGVVAAFQQREASHGA